MKAAKIAGLAVAALAVVAVLVKSMGGGAPRPPPAPPAVAAPAPPVGDDPRAREERLLSERAFSHPVDVPAPEVALVGADGKPVKLSALRGKIVFVNFWATWCPPCIEEMPSMVQLGRELTKAYPDRFRMVAVSGDDSWDIVHDYFRKTFGGEPTSLTLARDPEAAAARAYYCTARGYCPDVKFPETYVVDRRGHIVAMIVGPRDWSDPGARQWLEFLIRS